MIQAKTFDELINNINLDCDSQFTNEQLILECKRIHKEQRNKFIRLFVLKKIEKHFDQERKTMDTRSESDKKLLGPYLTVSEQNFKDAVKEIMKIEL